MTQFSEKEMQDIIQQTNIISQINHPTILKLIGFSPSNFKEEPKPTIITEMITKKRLFDILEFAKYNNSLVDWNNTKKFINIYGIASGMKCLHSFGIIHSNLNPKSIYLDVNMYPKMTDFGRLTQILIFNSMTYTDNFNKTLKIINSENSSKEKDVFEFGVIAYQIMMGEILFENNLPTFSADIKIPNCYKSLIEKCLSKNPNERPSFDDIVTTIENDIDFIMHDMNNDEISEYIKNTKCDCDEVDEI